MALRHCNIDFRVVHEFSIVRCELRGAHRGARSRQEAICPTGGIINNCMMQLLHAQFAEEMARRGGPPLFQKGVHWAGGSEFNAVMRTTLAERGY